MHLRYTGILPERKGWKQPVCGWKPVYVQHSTRLHRWLYRLVQAGNRPVPDGFFTGHDHALMGMGLMLSAGEVPRIAGQFGLETGTRANVTGAVYAAQGAMNLTRTVAAVVK